MFTTGFPLLLLLLATSGTVPDGMCTCIESTDSSLERDIRSADLIFEGVVLGQVVYPESWVDIEFEDFRPTVGFGSYEYNFFYASKVWKGSRRHDLVVATPRSDSMCGYDFEEGERYLVFASTLESQPTTYICTATQQASSADEERRILDAYFVR